MKKRVMTFVAACLALSVCAQKNGHTGYPITPVPFTAVKVNDAFWGQRLKASREVRFRWHSVNAKKQDATRISKWPLIPVLIIK